MPSSIHNSAAGSFIRRIQLVAVPHPVGSIKSLSWLAPFSVCSVASHSNRIGLCHAPDTDNWLAFAIPQLAVSISNNFCPLQVSFCGYGIVRFGGTCPLYFYYSLCLLLVPLPRPSKWKSTCFNKVQRNENANGLNLIHTRTHTHSHTHMAAVWHPHFAIFWLCSIRAIHISHARLPFRWGFRTRSFAFDFEAFNARFWFQFSSTCHLYGQRDMRRIQQFENGKFELAWLFSSYLFAELAVCCSHFSEGLDASLTYYKAQQ